MTNNPFPLMCWNVKRDYWQEIIDSRLLTRNYWQEITENICECQWINEERKKWFSFNPIKFGQTCAEHSNKLNNLLCPNISKNCSILLLLSFWFSSATSLLCNLSFNMANTCKPGHSSLRLCFVMRCTFRFEKLHMV